MPEQPPIPLSYRTPAPRRPRQTVVGGAALGFAFSFFAFVTCMLVTFPPVWTLAFPLQFLALCLVNAWSNGQENARLIWLLAPIQYAIYGGVLGRAWPEKHFRPLAIRLATFHLIAALCALAVVWHYWGHTMP